MTYTFLAPFVWFAFVASITPGPNNLMLMASGANFGFRRTLPHMLGVGLGFVFMVAMVGIGLAGVFDAFPWSYTALKVVSVLYLLYLAWKIANAAPPEPGAKAGKPFTFLQAAAFQWVNPKAWAMAVSAVTVYAPSRDLMTMLLIAALFGAVNLPSISAWVMMGQQMQRFLTNPARLRAFNIVMALLLVASLLLVLG
jgi:threonine/homoserine/homoserine lactone efflux protein